MVAWIVNDLSLAGQYRTADEFAVDLKALLTARSEIRREGHGITCSRGLHLRPVAAEMTLWAAVQRIQDRTLRPLAIEWLSRGPFWNEPSQAAGVSYFQSVDVTDQGLGEAARRRWLDEDARTFSFKGLPMFETTPLAVECLRVWTDTAETTEVPNAWDFHRLAPADATVAEVWSWSSFIDRACAAFTFLKIAGEQILHELNAYPFHRGAADRLFDLLKRLDELARNLHEFGPGSGEVAAWLRNNTMGHAADFSSEQPRDQSVFRFLDPDTGEWLYCPWHGKVHNPLQFRVHYQWPLPSGQNFIKILYIGNKITKS